MSQNKPAECPPWQCISETWDSDGYTRYTPSIESADTRKLHDYKPLYPSRDDTSTTSKNVSHHDEQECPPWQCISETWDSDGYTRYTPLIESADTRKLHDYKPLYPSRDDTSTTYKSVSHQDEQDSRSENRCRKECNDEKKKIQKRTSPIYVNAPSCYGYFSYQEVVQQLQGNVKILKNQSRINHDSGYDPTVRSIHRKYIGTGILLKLMYPKKNKNENI